jgi:hypothetical protein
MRFALRHRSVPSSPRAARHHDVTTVSVSQPRTVDVGASLAPS